MLDGKRFELAVLEVEYQKYMDELAKRYEIPDGTKYTVHLESGELEISEDQEIKKDPNIK